MCKTAPQDPKILSKEGESEREYPQKNHSMLWVILLRGVPRDSIVLICKVYSEREVTFRRRKWEERNSFQLARVSDKGVMVPSCNR